MLLFKDPLHGKYAINLVQEDNRQQDNPLDTKPTKWSNTLKQFVGFCRRIVWVCLATL